MYALPSFILLVLALPPFSVGTAAYLFFLPLLFCLEHFQSRLKLAMLEAALLGAAVGAYAYLGAYAEGWQLYALCIVLCTFLFAVCGYVTARLMAVRGHLWVLLCPLIWAAGEQTVNHIGLPFEFALTLDDSLVPLQLASLGGPWLVTTFLLFVQTAFFLSLRFTRLRRWCLAVGYGLVCAMVGLIVYGFGAHRINDLEASTVTTTSVAVAQTSLSPILLRDAADPGGLEIIVEQHRDLQKKLEQIPARNDLMVVWPESSNPAIRLAVDNDTLSLKKQVTNIVHTYALSSQNDLTSETLVLGKHGESISHSQKTRTVPFAERDITSSDRLIIHKNTKPDAAPAFGALICYESSFPDLARSLVKQGAKWLTVLTNDAFEWPSYLHSTNLSLARMRAIENGVTVARSANGGISAIITPTGAVQASVPLFAIHVALGSIQIPNKLTVYTQYGNQIDILFVIAAIGLMFGAHLFSRSHSPAVYNTTKPHSFYHSITACIGVLLVVLIVNKWQYDDIAQRYTAEFSTQWRPAANNHEVIGTDELSAALTYVHRRYGFLQTREPFPVSAEGLRVWAQGHGLKPQTGNLDDARPALRYSMTGLIKLAAGDIAVVIARDDDDFRLYFPIRQRYRWVPLQRLRRMQIGPMVWLLPSDLVSDVGQKIVQSK